MTTKKLLHALDLVRADKLEEALDAVDELDVGFVLRRLAHYRTQPDHREAASALADAYDLRRRSARAARAGRLSPPAAATFHAPLGPAVVEHAPTGSIDFANPEPFLVWASSNWDKSPPLDLDAIHHLDVWAVVALSSMTLAERTRRPRVVGDQSGATRFAHALGLNELSGGLPSALYEPQRTVRLTRVRTSNEIEPAADRMASLVVRNQDSRDVRLTIRHVLVELLRNVIQHSGDPLGAVVAAQAMPPSLRRPETMIQLAVADMGIGIPRHLHKQHPHLTDYRQALERALLPHISGTFEEGQMGSFENAGLGLYVTAELARHAGGNLLIATTGAALVVQKDASGSSGHPRFLQPPGIGFPGTLVAVEIPTDAVQDYHALIRTILEKTRERAPKRTAGHWVAFGAGPDDARRISLESIRERTPEALKLASKEIEPAILRRQPVELDFGRIELCTQSWLHALLYESIRLAWAKRVPIHVVNVVPAVQEGLRFLESYALGD